jgi:predicted nucleic acid-binding protein
LSVIVDTNVWSLALRRRRADLSPGEHDLVSTAAELLGDGRAILLGIIRQEVLSGVPDSLTFARLRDEVATLPDEPLSPIDHVRAAEMFNECRTRGVQCAAIDILLCAVAERLNAQIFTTDRDFETYARHLPVSLFRPRADA